MEYKHIEYFIETCGYKSMSQAAEALFISQQALSRCIANLEAELGCKLFRRTAKGSALTEEGKYLYEQFNPIVRSFRNTVSQTVSYLEHRPREVTFACAPMIFSILDTELLFAFQEAHPEITLKRLELSDKDVDQYVGADPSHFGMLAIPEDRHGKRFDYVPVRTLPLKLYVHKDHPLAKAETVTFSMLREEHFLTLEERSHYHSMIDEKAKEAGFLPRKTFSSGDVNQIWQLVNRGKGIFLAPETPSVRLLYPDVASASLADESLTYSIAFIFRDYDQLDQPSRTFLSFVVEYAAGESIKAR